MINDKAVTMDLTCQQETCAEIIRHKPCIGMLLKNNSPANINKYNCIADKYLVPHVHIVFVIF